MSHGQPKPNTYDFWSASARNAYDEMEKRALDAEARLEQIHDSLQNGFDPSRADDTLTWNMAMMRTLNDLLREAASTLNPSKIFDSVTRIICQYLDATSVYICDWNTTQHTTTVLAEHISKKASEVEHESDIGIVYPLGEPFERLMVENPEYWVNHHEEQKFPHADLLEYEYYGVKTTVYAPLHSNDQLIGFIEVWDTKQKCDYTEKQIEFLVFIARQIAGSVRMAQLHRQLSESESRYRILMNTIQGGVAQTDMVGTIKFANQHFADIVGMDVLDILEQKLDTLWDRFATKTDLPDEYRIDDPDGTSRWFQVTHAELPADTDQYIGEAVIFTDITRRKEMETFAINLGIEKERTHILAQFVKDTSHEFYTPLSVINTRLFVMKKQIGDNINLLNGVQTIQYQSDLITQLVKALVEMTKLDATSYLSLKSHSMTDIIIPVIQSYTSKAKQNQQILQFESDSKHHMARVDTKHLGNAFRHILDNALRYTPANGTILVRLEEADDRIIITIQDDGIGMESELQDRIFERFYRVDEAHTTHGFGLGLSITKRIIELHNGTIDVLSVKHEGTTVRITIAKA